MQPARLLCPRSSPHKNTGVGCHVFLQGIFPSQGSNSSLLHCRRILYHLGHQGSPWHSLGHPYCCRWHYFILFNDWVILYCINVPHLLYVPIPLSMAIEVASMFWLLYTVLQWTSGYIYPFGSCFSPDICPGVGLQGHMVALFFVYGNICFATFKGYYTMIKGDLSQGHKDLSI